MRRIVRWKAWWRRHDAKKAFCINSILKGQNCTAFIAVQYLFSLFISPQVKTADKSAAFWWRVIFVVIGFVRKSGDKDGFTSKYLFSNSPINLVYSWGRQISGINVVQKRFLKTAEIRKSECDISREKISFYQWTKASTLSQIKYICIATVIKIKRKPWGFN